MARSALLSRLRKIAAQQLAARGDTAASSRGLAARMQMSRRAFLVGAGAVTAALALPRGARAASTPRVAVVGGGISGLAAALTLSDAGGHAVTVYEAGGRLGGRMFSNTKAIGGTSFWDEDQVTEWCGELVDTGHETIQALCTRYNLPLDDLAAAAPAGSNPVYFFDGAYYTIDEVNADFGPVLDAIIADSDASIPDNKADGSPNDDGTVLFDAITDAGIALDNISVFEWIEQKVPGGHASKIGRLLDLAYSSEFGADSTDQSALNLVLLLSGDTPGDPFFPFGESDERFHIRGGNQQLPLAIAADLTSKLGADAIQLNTRLTKIKANDDGTVTLSFDTTSGGQVTSSDVEADGVILALPFAVLADKVDFSEAGFDDRKIRAITQLGRGLCSKLQLQFTSRLWNTTGAWGLDSGEETFSDNGNQCSWHVTRAQPGTSGIMNGYTGGTPTVLRAQTAPVSFSPVSDTNGVATLATAFNAQLEEIFPGITALHNGKATLSIPSNDPNMRLSYSYWRVGQYQDFAGYERAPQGNVFFAGEHCSVLFQGFMEGGAGEGVRAANEVLAATLGATPPAKKPPAAAPSCDDSGVSAHGSGTALASAGVVAAAAVALSRRG